MFLTLVLAGSITVLLFSNHNFLVFLMALESALLTLLALALTQGMGVGVLCLFLAVAAFESGVGLSLILRSSPVKGSIVTSL